MSMRSLAPWSRRSSPATMFDDLISDFDRSLSPSLLRNEMDFYPNIDVEETDKMYCVKADLPGMKKDEIKVDFSNDVLTISGERVREASSTEKGTGTRHSERVYGKFQRTFSMPSHILGDKIEASFTDGVLSIILPKAEGSRTHSIRIQ